MYHVSDIKTIEELKERFRTLRTFGAAKQTKFLIHNAMQCNAALDRKMKPSQTMPKRYQCQVFVDKISSARSQRRKNALSSVPPVLSPAVHRVLALTRILDANKTQFSSVDKELNVLTMYSNNRCTACTCDATAVATPVVLAIH